VKKGDKLATFNVSGANAYVTEAKNAYDKALKEYNDTKKTASDNSKRKLEIANEIAALNEKIAMKQSEIAVLEKELEGVTIETAPIPEEQINQIAMQMLANGSNLMQIKAFREAAATIEVPVTDEASSASSRSLCRKTLSWHSLIPSFQLFMQRMQLQLFLMMQLLKLLAELLTVKRQNMTELRLLSTKWHQVGLLKMTVL
jgi:hypothetical protein